MLPKCAPGGGNDDGGGGKLFDAKGKVRRLKFAFYWGAIETQPSGKEMGEKAIQRIGENATAGRKKRELTKSGTGKEEKKTREWTTKKWWDRMGLNNTKENITFTLSIVLARKNCKSGHTNLIVCDGPHRKICIRCNKAVCLPAPLEVCRRRAHCWMHIQVYMLNVAWVSISPATWAGNLYGALGVTPGHLNDLLPRLLWPIEQPNNEEMGWDGIAREKIPNVRPGSCWPERMVRVRLRPSVHRVDPEVYFSVDSSCVANVSGY